MEERAAGIIFRSRPFSDTSCIVHWFTREHGRIATLARGARRPKSPLRGKIDLAFRGNLLLIRSRRSDLHTLREFHLEETYPKLRRNVVLLEQIAYGWRLTEQATEPESPMPDWYDQWIGLLDVIGDFPPSPWTIPALETRLLVELGLDPRERIGRGPSQGLAPCLEALTTLPWQNILAPGALKENPVDMLRFLKGYLIYHLERIPSRRPEKI